MPRDLTLRHRVLPGSARKSGVLSTPPPAPPMTHADGHPRPTVVGCSASRALPHTSQPTDAPPMDLNHPLLRDLTGDAARASSPEPALRVSLRNLSRKLVSWGASRSISARQLSTGRLLRVAKHQESATGRHFQIGRRHFGVYYSLSGLLISSLLSTESFPRPTGKTRQSPTPCEFQFCVSGHSAVTSCRPYRA